MTFTKILKLRLMWCMLAMAACIALPIPALFMGDHAPGGPVLRLTQADIVSFIALTISLAGLVTALVAMVDAADKAEDRSSSLNPIRVTSNHEAYGLDILEGLPKWPYVIDVRDLRESIVKPQDFASGQILNGETLDKVDLFILPDSPFSLAQISNRRYVEVALGHALPFASPEDSVITKLRWFVLGNRISDRLWNDIGQVLEMQSGQLDEDYLANWAAHFGLYEWSSNAKTQCHLQ